MVGLHFKNFLAFAVKLLKFVLPVSDIMHLRVEKSGNHPVHIYLFKVNNKNTFFYCFYC